MSKQNRERLHSIEERLDRLEALVDTQPAPADGPLDRIERQLARIERYIAGTATPLDLVEASIDVRLRAGERDDDTMAEIRRERRETLARLTAAANKITDQAYGDPDDGRSQALLTCTDDLLSDLKGELGLFRAYVAGHLGNADDARNKALLAHTDDLVSDIKDELNAFRAAVARHLSAAADDPPPA